MVALRDLLLLAGVAFAQAVTKCPASKAPNPPAHAICNKQGTLSSPSSLGSSVGDSFVECRDQCLADSECISFSYQQAQNRCMRYSARLVNQGFQQQQNGIVHYNRHCFRPGLCTVAVTVVKTSTQKQTVSRVDTVTKTRTIIAGLGKTATITKTKTRTRTVTTQLSTCSASASNTFSGSLCIATATATASASVTCSACPGQMPPMSSDPYGYNCPFNRAACDCGAGAGADVSCPVTVQASSCFASPTPAANDAMRAPRLQAYPSLRPRMRGTSTEGLGTMRAWDRHTTMAGGF